MNIPDMSTLELLGAYERTLKEQMHVEDDNIDYLSRLEDEINGREVPQDILTRTHDRVDKYRITVFNDIDI